jgi:hypothetical protein
VGLFIELPIGKDVIASSFNPKTAVEAKGGKHSILSEEPTAREIKTRDLSEN